MASNPSSFNHPPLPGEPSIRLLNLHPGKSSSPLSCTLSHALLDASEDTYEALSYTWGDPNPRCRILVDGTTFWITENLESALRHLRSEGKTRTLWVDSVCINQADDKEKSVQVRHMHQVYSRAKRVVVWLGPEADDSGLALRVLHRLGTDQRIVREIRFDKFKIRAEARHIWQSPASQRALSAIGHRAYWSRGWIVQELMSAKEAVVMAGHHAIDWSTLVQSMMVILRSNNSLGEWTECLLSLTPLGALCSSFEELRSEKTQFPLLHHVRTWLENDVSDQRDRVFAFINLSSRDDTTNLKDDYSRTVAEVFEDFARWSIETSQTLDVLSYGSSISSTVSGITTYGSGVSRAQSNHLDKPGFTILTNLGTWAPVWIDSDWSAAPLVDRKAGTPPLYHASKDSLVEDPFAIKDWHPSCKHILAASGFAVDRIQEVGSILLLPTESPVSLEPSAIADWEEMMNRMDSSNNRYSSKPIDMSDVFCQYFVEGLAVGADGEMVEPAVWTESEIGKEDYDGDKAGASQGGSGTEFSLNLVSLETKPLGFLEKAVGSGVSRSEIFTLPDTDPQRATLREGFWRTLIVDRHEPGHFAAQINEKHGVPLLLPLAQPGRATRSVWRSFSSWYGGSRQTSEGNPQAQEMVSFPASMLTVATGRRFMVTETGYMGLVPPNAEVGSLICVVQGSQTSIVLAETDDWKVSGKSSDPAYLPVYHSLGNCYVHGIMDEEAWRDDVEPQPFLI